MQYKCLVERITYQNPENGYCVLKAQMKGYKDLVTVVGTFCGVVVGSTYLIEGEWKTDKKYGEQIVANYWEECMPASVYGIEKYLAGGLIKGIGPVFAHKIVETFGIDTIDIIENNIDRLREIPGLGEKKLQFIKESWSKSRKIKNVMIFLQGHNVSPAYAVKIYKTYGDDSIDIVTENPYRLADDIWGIGFKTADTIAQNLGFDKNCEYRLSSGIIYTLNKLSEDGHLYETHDNLVNKAIELLEADGEKIKEVIAKLIETQGLIKDEEAIYIPSLYFSEIGVASKLNRMKALETGDEYKVNIERIQEITKIQYDEIQQQAIKNCLNHNVMVLTGGPGTGKTTTLKGIIAALKSFGKRILLAAPTGRAAKRMSELTNMEAKTIHRLLEYKPPEGYQKNETNPLFGDVLIVDESSMIDIPLMNSLCKAIPERMKLILVGDVDQLPSVGPGNVLRDIIESGVFYVVKLEKVFRQAQQSRIIMNAHKINEGIYPDISNGANTDFYFMEAEDAEETVEKVVELVNNRLPKFYNVKKSDIEVLTPMQKGVAGAQNINLKLQEVLNPYEGGLQRGGIIYKKNDKVMQIKNNYDKEVFNGDIGFIKEVDLENREIEVTFDGRDIRYDSSELDELVLAYAVTVHKSQGSEYPVVVMPILMSYYVMLQRNLIYTGVTRAKKVFVFVGQKKAIGFAVRKLTVYNRNTKLKERLINCEIIYKNKINK